MIHGPARSRRQALFAAGIFLGWRGNYHGEDRAFVYADREAGRIITILGYLTAKIAQLG
jgi:hypothetical protein